MIDRIRNRFLYEEETERPPGPEKRDPPLGRMEDLGPYRPSAPLDDPNLRQLADDIRRLAEEARVAMDHLSERPRYYVNTPGTTPNAIYHLWRQQSTQPGCEWWRYEAVLRGLDYQNRASYLMLPSDLLLEMGVAAGIPNPGYDVIDCMVAWQAILTQPHWFNPRTGQWEPQQGTVRAAIYAAGTI